MVTREIAKAVQNVSEEYSQASVLRAGIALIPLVGPSIDAIFGGLGAQWQAERIQTFTLELSARLAAVEKQTLHANVEPSEPLFDFVRRSFTLAAEIRSAERRSALVNLCANQFRKLEEWDEAEGAALLLAALAELDLAVLAFASKTIFAGKPFEGKRVVATRVFPDLPSSHPASLTEAFPSQPSHALQLATSNLVARGLLHDVGVGHFGVRALEFLEITDLGNWLMTWIEAESSPGA